jgi:hypothetical protein
MKAKLLIIICMVFSIVALGQNVKTINYKFNEESLSDLLPFDQHFVIKVTDLEDMDSLILKIYEIKKYAYKKLYNEKGGSNNELKMEIIKKNELAFISPVFTRANDFKNGICKIQVTAYLQPNSRYVLEFKTKKLTPLSDAQQEELTDAIRNDAQIQNLLNTEIVANLRANASNRSATNWTPLTKQLSQRANTVIMAVNTDYTIKKDIDFHAQLLKVNNILRSNINILERLGILTKRYREFITDSLIPNGTDKRNNELRRVNTDSSRFAQMLTNDDWINLNEDRIDAIMDFYKRVINKNFISDTAIKRKLSDNEIDVEKKLQNILVAKDEFVAEFVKIKVNTVFNSSGSGSTYSPDLIVRAKQHVTFDAGYAYVWSIDRGNAYVGMNIYFRGVDTSLPLKNYRANFKDYMGSHFSLLIGLSVESIKKDSVRRGLLGNGSALITGIGYKLLPWFKINGGAYLYYKYPVNPLYDKQRVSFTASPFVSLSIDVNLSTLFNSFSNGNIFKQL